MLAPGDRPSGSASTTEDVVELVVPAAARSTAPVWVMPGHADGRGDRPPRLRPHACGPRRQRRRVQRLRAAHRDAPWFATGRSSCEDRRRGCRSPHAGPPLDGRPRPSSARGTLEDFKADPEFARARLAEAPPRAADAVSRRTSHEGYALGHGRSTSVRLHRLQRLRRRLPGGEQHPRRRQGAGAARPRDALAPHRPLLRGRSGDDPGILLPADALPCTARTRRARWSARWRRRRTAPRA